MEEPKAKAVLRVALLALLVWTPLPFGAVQPGAVLALELHAALLGLLALWVLKHDADRLPPVARRVLALSAIVLAVGLLQLIPLPQSWIATLAPQAAEARALLTPILKSQSTFAPLSLEPQATADALLRFTSYVLVGLAAAVALDTPERVKQAAWVLAASGAFQALYGATEYLSGHQHIFGYAKRFYTDEASGTFINRNHFAAYLAATLPLALAMATRGRAKRTTATSWRERGLALLEPRGVGLVVAALAAAAIWIGIVLSYSRAGFAVALAATVAFALGAAGRVRAAGRVAAALLLLPTLVLLFQEVRAPGERFAADEEELRTLGGRVEVWGVGLEMAKEHVVLGTGLGTFESAFAPRRPPGVELRWTHAHSDWLEAAIEGGLPVLCAVAGIALLVVRHLLRAARGAVPAALAAALLALAIHAAVDFPLRIPAVAVVAAVLVGAALSVEEEPAGASLVVLARPVAVA